MFQSCGPSSGLHEEGPQDQIVIHLNFFASIIVCSIFLLLSAWTFSPAHLSINFWRCALAFLVKWSVFKRTFVTYWAIQIWNIWGAFCEPQICVVPHFWLTLLPPLLSKTPLANKHGPKILHTCLHSYATGGKGLQLKTLVMQNENLIINNKTWCHMPFRVAIPRWNYGLDLLRVCV